MVKPHPSQDLFEVYSLTGNAAGVARHFPDGKKNTLRKSYKGKIKDSGISGQFDSVKKELDAPDTLFAMMMQPQEEWDAKYTLGKDIEKGIPEAVRANLGKAMTMARGIVPKEMWNNSVLGELAAPAFGATPTAKPIQAGVKPAIGQNAAVARIAKGDIPRPKRNIKKRTYGDASFEGYGEGFVDDEVQDGGYSTGEGDERAMGQKRRKKVGSLIWLSHCMTNEFNAQTPANHTFQGPIRQNSYGPGMVGA